VVEAVAHSGDRDHRDRDSAPEPQARLTDRRVHLVMSSGGVRALAYVGVIQALEADEIEPVSVSACSAGAVVGALYAAA
jgi:predicted acylesterase/phospholipase RssA